nr:testis-expressed sequence 10 protein-like [Ipomoea batatas]
MTLLQENQENSSTSLRLISAHQDGKGPFISLIMVYIFSAMTNLAIEVRLMAFKFLDLVIQNYPSTFSMYAEKILQNYGDILQKNKFFLQDKGKLKTALSGLVRCLSLLPFKNRSADDLSDKKDIHVQVTLHAFVPDISSDSSGLSSSGVVEKLKNLLPALVSCFQDFSPLVHTMPQMDTQSYDCMLLILQNIDLLVRFFIDETPYHHTHVNISDQRISLLALKKLWDEFPFNPIHDLSKKENDRYFMLNVVITEIFLKISHWDHPPPALMEKFLEFIEISLSEKVQL